VIGRDMLFETETLEQRFLHHRPLAHHRPLSRFTNRVKQRPVTAASRSFSTDSSNSGRRFSGSLL